METIRAPFAPDQIDQLNSMAASFSSKKPLSVEQVKFIKSLGALNPKAVDDFFIREVSEQVYKKGLRLTAASHPKLVNWAVSFPKETMSENESSDGSRT